MDFSTSTIQEVFNIIRTDEVYDIALAHNHMWTDFPVRSKVAYQQPKIWDLAQPIPVAHDGDKRVVDALANITFILNSGLEPDSHTRKIHFEKVDESVVISAGRGLIFRNGSAIGLGGVIDENTKGHVSKAEGTTDWPQHFFNANGIISTILYVHFDSSKGTADTDTIVHEIMHSLGLFGHFPGFGIGPQVSNRAYAVLKLLYTDPRDIKGPGD